jgi:hypothetical protein
MACEAYSCCGYAGKCIERALPLASAGVTFYYSQIALLTAHGTDRVILLPFDESEGSTDSCSALPNEG